MLLQGTRFTAQTEEDALEEFHSRGWTDGLPVVIPTPIRVERMLTAGGLDPDVIVGTVAPREGSATVEKIAVNAVMAGCLPEHLPVVIAAVRAVCDPSFDLGGVQSTTHALGPVLIVNGDARIACGPIASGWGALGPGHRANACIGRALRLVLINIGGALPGMSDMAVLGQPGKFTCCLGEAEEESPFPPLHTEFGFDVNESAVTVVGVEAPTSVRAIVGDDDPASVSRLLGVIAATIANVGANNAYHGRGAIIVVLNPLHARVLANAGMTRQSIQERLAERAVNRRSFLSQFNRVSNGDPDDLLPAVRSPEDIILVVGGGPGIYSAVFNSWGGGQVGGLSVTKEIQLGFTCDLPRPTL